MFRRVGNMRKIFLLLVAISLCLPSIIPPVSSREEYKIIGRRLVDDIWLNHGGWPKIYDGGGEDASIGVVVDSKGNIVVTGYSYNLSTKRYNFVTIKYDPDGEEIWHNVFDSGMHDIPWDIDIDSEDNIVIIGMNGNTIEDIKNFSGNYLIVKYNYNGVEQWHKMFKKPGENNFPLGISTDYQDNIIITGGFGSISSLDLSCWTMKINEDGDELWNTTFHENIADLGFDVDTDRDGNIVVIGFYFAFPIGGGISSLKYDINGNLLWRRWYGGNEPYHMIIDDEDNIYIAGINWSYYTNSQTWYVMKCDREGIPLWINEYDSGYHDAASDVAVNSNGEVFVVGFSSFSKPNTWEHCIIVYDQRGREICMKRPGVRGLLLGVDIDERRGVVVTGEVENFTNINYYTNWYTDFSPPTGVIDKPIEGYLYLFDKKLFKNPWTQTIIVGGITIEFSADQPSDVNYIEFYIDNKLREILMEAPYEWGWHENGFGKHILKIIVYDHSGDASRYTLEAWKLL